MSRLHPRFLFSNPSNTKSPGPFIVQLLEPCFICRLIPPSDPLFRENKSDFYYHKGICLQYLNAFPKFDFKGNGIGISAVIAEMQFMAEWALNSPEVKEYLKNAR